MKKSFLTFCLAALIAVSAQGKTMKLPDDDNAVATITIPDSWDPDAIENGVAGTSDDDAVYLAAVAVSSKKGMDAEIEDTFAMLKEHKVDLDQSTKKENKFKVNGLDAEELLFQGKDEDGPTSVSICFVPIKDSVIVLTYWVTTKEEAKHQAEVGKIVNSLKPSA
ncbi:MAG: histidine kinase [Chthoniobacterales bacterium]